MRPSSPYLRSSVLRRRIRSVARCFAVAISQAPGLSGTPEVGHCSSAATKASCASSSAVPMSLTMRASPAMSRADSIRQMASTARCVSVAAVPRPPKPSDAPRSCGAMGRAPSSALAHGDLADLEDPTVVRCPLEPLEGFVHRTHLPQPVSRHELLRLRERPVDHGPLLPLESNALPLCAGSEPPGTDDHAGL